MRRSVLLATLLLASTTLAQDAEFARVFGGEIKATAKKQSRGVSGSLGLTRGDRGFGDRYDATLGGSLANERLWFFASATMMPMQSIDWRNIELDAPLDGRQTAAPEIPTSFLMLRSTNIFSDTSTLNISISRNY
jgi:hypothetical protein